MYKSPIKKFKTKRSNFYSFGQGNSKFVKNWQNRGVWAWSSKSVRINKACL